MPSNQAQNTIHQSIANLNVSEKYNRIIMKVGLKMLIEKEIIRKNAFYSLTLTDFISIIFCSNISLGTIDLFLTLVLYVFIVFTE